MVSTFSQSAKPDKQPSEREEARAAKRHERQKRYLQARELHAQGVSIREIARRLGCSSKAMRRYLRDSRCPDWNPGRQPPTQLDAYAEFVAEWIVHGGRNSAELHHLLKAKGCPASYDAVRRNLNRKLGSSGHRGPRDRQNMPPPRPKPTARKLSFAFINPDRAEEPSGIFKVIDERLPKSGAALDMARELADMFRRKVSKPLTDWLKETAESGIGELKSFASSLRDNEKVVQAALTEEWSNRPTEGQVNRLKVIKRSMYGRARFDLLRARVQNKSQWVQSQVLREHRAYKTITKSAGEPLLDADYQNRDFFVDLAQNHVGNLCVKPPK